MNFLRSCWSWKTLQFCFRSQPTSASWTDCLQTSFHTPFPGFDTYHRSSSNLPLADFLYLSVACFLISNLGLHFSNVLFPFSSDFCFPWSAHYAYSRSWSSTLPLLSSCSPVFRLSTYNGKDPLQVYSSLFSVNSLHFRCFLGEFIMPSGHLHSTNPSTSSLFQPSTSRFKFAHFPLAAGSVQRSFLTLGFPSDRFSLSHDQSA